MDLSSEPVHIWTDFTSSSHLLCGDALKTVYSNFRLTVLRQAEWATWHSNLRGPFPKGWCIRKGDLPTLQESLRAHQIPFVVLAHPDPGQSQPKQNHPPFKVMIAKAIMELKEHSGSSRIAIKKYILANWHVSGKYLDTHFNYHLKKMVTRGQIVPTSGRARFKVRKISPKPLKTKKAVVVKKPDTQIGYVDRWVAWTAEDFGRSVTYEIGNAGFAWIKIKAGDNVKTYIDLVRYSGTAIDVSATFSSVAQLSWKSYH